MNHGSTIKKRLLYPWHWQSHHLLPWLSHPPWKYMNIWKLGCSVATFDYRRDPKAMLIEEKLPPSILQQLLALSLFPRPLRGTVRRVLLYLRFCRPAVSLPRPKRQGETRNSTKHLTGPDPPRFGFLPISVKTPARCPPKNAGIKSLVHHPVSKSDVTTTHFPNRILS